jgi:thymidine phosphorylase
MLILGRLADDPQTAADKLQHALASGAAAERLGRMIAALGGPADFVERPERHLPHAPHITAVEPARVGFVSRIDVRQVGLVVLGLGGGRRRVEDEIDHAVGLTEVAGIGARVGPDQPLARVHARSKEAAALAARALSGAFAIGDSLPGPNAVIRQRIGRA